jgi:hypothetical protein
MKQATQVIAETLGPFCNQDVKYSEGMAKEILDRLNAAGFQIMEPSDKVFNSMDPVVIEDARAAMQAILTNPRYSIERGLHADPLLMSVAEESYIQAYAMKQEREKRHEQLT